MEHLKLTSLRIPEKCLQSAEKMTAGNRYWKTAEVLRLAISYGLLILQQKPVSLMCHHMYEYDMGWGHFDIDVKWVPNEPCM